MEFDQTSSGFDWSSISMWLTVACVGVAGVIVIIRLTKAFAQNDSKGTDQVSIEAKSKIYLSHLVDAGIFVAVVMIARVVVGFIAGWLTDGFGTLI